MRGARWRKAAPEFSATLKLEFSFSNMGLEEMRNAGRPVMSSELPYFLPGSVGREAAMCSWPHPNEVDHLSLWTSGKTLLGQGKEQIVAQIPQTLPFLRFSLISVSSFDVYPGHFVKILNGSFWFCYFYQSFHWEEDLHMPSFQKLSQSRYLYHKIAPKLYKTPN